MSNCGNFIYCNDSLTLYVNLKFPIRRCLNTKIITVRQWKVNVAELCNFDKFDIIVLNNTGMDNIKLTIAISKLKPLLNDNGLFKFCEPVDPKLLQDIYQSLE